jgi:hypothetical protein
MAAYLKFDDFVEQLVLAKHNLGAANDVLKVFLTNEQPLAADTIKADMVEITAGNGYTAGGTDIQNSITVAGGTVTIACVDVVWTASGGTIGPFQFVVTYNDTQTAPADALVNWWDRGAALTLQIGESFTVDFGGNKLFDLS